MSTYRDELGRLVPSLSEDVAANVLDFARAQQAKEESENASFRFDGEIFFAKMKARSRRRPAL